ncbi:MAG TPA: S8 family serine peptidase [Miltoncostaeaceae bacterium]|nr:S8 family serine peptidase [Miltoncostaeaceae bacterium]
MRSPVPRGSRALAAVAAAALLGAAAATASAAGPAKPPDPPAGAGQVSFGRPPAGDTTLLVTFSDRPDRDRAAARLAGLGDDVRPVVPEAGVWALGPASPATARDAALRRPRVTAAEWSLARTPDDRPPPPAAPGPTPVFTDPYFTPPSQWGLLAGPSWSADLTTPGPRPRIAILDSGIDATHEEWGGPGSPLVAPRSTLRGDLNASDHGESGHGTHVAGIAAAPANGVGVVGVAPAGPAAQVIPVQIADTVGASTDETMMKGIRHAVGNGAKVINISAGGPGFSRAFQDTVLFATRRGALIVASVGNQGQDLNALNFPAGYSRVLGVGAQCDGTVTFDCPKPFQTATFSNHNRTVDVIAPGVNILSSVPVRVTDRAVAPGYALKDGTSMAAPYVTGVAALVMAANGGRLSPYQVARQITNTALDLGPRGRDDVNGYGLVNPRAAVTLRAPSDDASEVNDDVKWVRSRTTAFDRSGRATITATADRYEDPDDVYPLRLRRGDRVALTLTHRTAVLDLYLWEPGTPTVGTANGNLERHLLAFRSGGRKKVVINYTAKRSGVHYVDVFARRGGDAYTLRISRKG